MFWMLFMYWWLNRGLKHHGVVDEFTHVAVETVSDRNCVHNWVFNRTFLCGFVLLILQKVIEKVFIDIFHAIITFLLICELFFQLSYLVLECCNVFIVVSLVRSFACAGRQHHLLSRWNVTNRRSALLPVLKFNLCRVMACADTPVPLRISKYLFLRFSCEKLWFLHRIIGGATYRSDMLLVSFAELLIVWLVILEEIFKVDPRKNLKLLWWPHFVLNITNVCENLILNAATVFKIIWFRVKWELLFMELADIGAVSFKADFFWERRFDNKISLRTLWAFLPGMFIIHRRNLE